MRSGRLLLICALAAIAVAGAGQLLTTLGPWYFSLRVPAWKPPDWLFAPVWTTIFTLGAISAWLSLLHASEPEQRRAILYAFGANAVFNILWSALFFGLHRPNWALADVALLWLSIIVLMACVGKTSRTAALLLIPYLLWVSLAAALNAEIVRLNGPFD